MLLWDVGGVPASGDERCCQLHATLLLKAGDYTTSSQRWWYRRHMALLRGSGGGATGGMQSWYEWSPTMLPEAREVSMIGRWLCYKRHMGVLWAASGDATAVSHRSYWRAVGTVAWAGVVLVGVVRWVSPHVCSTCYFSRSHGEVASRKFRMETICVKQRAHVKRSMREIRGSEERSAWSYFKNSTFNRNHLLEKNSLSIPN
jgi:hypothetical protein